MFRSTTGSARCTIQGLLRQHLCHSHVSSNSNSWRCPKRDQCPLVVRLLRIRARRLANLTMVTDIFTETVNSFAMSVGGKSSKQEQIMSRIIICAPAGALEAAHVRAAATVISCALARHREGFHFRDRVICLGGFARCILERLGIIIRTGAQQIVKSFHNPTLWGKSLRQLRGSSPAARCWQPLPPEALGEGLPLFRLSTTEHHEVAVIAAQGVGQRRHR